MAYQVWEACHRDMAETISQIVEDGEQLAKRANVKPGSIRYLWADAIATQLYDDFHE
jgi:hypothetical protein